MRENEKGDVCKYTICDAMSMRIPKCTVRVQSLNQSVLCKMYEHNVHRFAPPIPIHNVVLSSASEIVHTRIKLGTQR